MLARRQILAWWKCAPFFFFFLVNLERKLLNNKTAQAFLEHNRKYCLKTHFFFKQPLVHGSGGGGAEVEAGCRGSGCLAAYRLIAWGPPRLARPLTPRCWNPAALTTPAPRWTPEVTFSK